MATIPSQHAVKHIVWTWIKCSPVLSAITAYFAFNILSIVLLGGFTELALLTNLFPGVMAFFLSAMYNEGRLSKKDGSKLKS